MDFGVLRRPVAATGAALGLAIGVGLAFGVTSSEAQDQQSNIPFLQGEYEKVDAAEKSGISEAVSGYWFRTAQTRALQDDDFENPAFIWLEQGEELWTVAEGTENKSCASCHNDADESMKGVGASYPKFNKESGKLINLEQQINRCRTESMGADAWKWESDELLGMTIYVRHQSRGMPVNVSIDGEAAPFFEAGKEFYYERRGQLDMSCASCHVDYYGQYIRADLLSQGQSNGFPTYRLKWQKVGSLHRRFRGCNKQVRSEPFKAGSDEYVNLELFLAYKGNGLPVETPAVRQ